MGLPLVPILSAITPVVLGAFDLYRNRREAKEAHSRPPFEKDGPRSLDDQRKRLQELESSDVEQARLISELSNTVEALAKSLQREIEDGRKRDVQMRRLLWVSIGTAGVALVLALVLLGLR